MRGPTKAALASRVRELETEVVRLLSKVEDLKKCLAERTEGFDAEVRKALDLERRLEEMTAVRWATKKNADELNGKWQAEKAKVARLEAEAKRELLERAVVERERDFYWSVLELAKHDADKGVPSAWLPVMLGAGVAGLWMAIRGMLRKAPALPLFGKSPILSAGPVS